MTERKKPFDWTRPDVFFFTLFIVFLIIWVGG